MATISDSQKRNLVLKPVTSKGAPAILADAPLWSVSDTNIASLVVSPDGLFADVIGVSLGTVTVSVIANADLSGGIREISASVDITVTPSEAVSMTIEVGEAQDA